MPRPSALTTHPRDLVLKQLQQSDKPLTAYDLLAALTPKGIKHIPTIYRALDWLVKKGEIHKVKELSAYVACDCAHSHKHHISALTVCGTCAKVEELHDEQVLHTLEKLTTLGVPLAEDAVIELPVTCAECAG